MDNLGSEVGQKMRSAVKAKLLELGTGGSAGYIDDELPDYVMIMVANKRSKQQMIADLNLFLGSQTDLFVTWLHEVLQKLQEVTLPAVALQKKRKNSQKEEASSSKHDKREKKKDKKTQKKPSDHESEDISSITDVFAGEFLEKAKKTFEIDESGVQKDKKQESPTHRDETDDFDIPTITEISNRVTTTAPIENREKDLAELAEIQKKIYAAKKQLKILDDADESEDEDFLNIKEDGEEFDETGDLIREKKKPPKAKSPIVFDRNEEAIRAASILDSGRGEVSHTERSERSDSVPDFSSNRHRLIEFSESSEHEKERAHAPKDKTPRKRSIRERLGHVSRGSEHTQPHRRAEKELYVPAFRRRELEKEKREKKSNGEVDERHSRKRSNSRDKHRQDNSSERSSQHRIGSRVVVAPPKPELPSNDESDSQHPERPVNSVIKIKPRPSISPSKQACKNLLLRAVAEAQRSTILVKPKKDISVRKNSANSPTKRNTKFFTKSYRDRIGRDALLRRTAKNLVIEVKADMRRQSERDKDEEMLQEEEYVPEIISDRGESDIEPIYVPQSLNMTNNEDEENGHGTIEDNSSGSKTQFVVTLNDKNSSNYKSKSKTSRLNGIESKSRQTMNANLRDKVDIRSRLTLKSDAARNDRGSNSSPSCSTPPRPSSSMSSSKKTELIKIYRKPKEIKKIVIKNDSEDEEFSSPKKESTNKLHIPKEEKRFSDAKELSCPSTEEEEGSTTPPLPVRAHDEKTAEITPNKRKRQLIKFDLSKQHKTDESVPAKRRSKSGEPDREFNMDTTGDERHKISTKNVESKKYDNLPSSLNSVSIDSLIIKAKPKERCKYYPSCTKDTCDFYHPAAACKSFPNCKYADKCLYVHPKCKFDQTCNKIGCNFQHTASIPGQCSAPPLSSHVVPVQNYKSISTSAAPSMCKFYPNCSKPSCPFFHPKMCRFGRNCNNKLECNFYHHDVASNKFKWVASVV